MAQGINNAERRTAFPTNGNKIISEHIESSYPERKKQRLKGFDYSSGNAYFITFNTHNNSYILSEIHGSYDATECKANVSLLRYGEIVESQITRLKEMYEDIDIFSYVIMPNHVHMIVCLTENNKLSISRYIGLLKRMCNKECGINLWQKSFYDHIIRDEDDFLKHAVYIDENPKKWIMGKDRYYV